MSLYYFDKLHLTPSYTGSYKEYTKSNIIGYGYYKVQIKEEREGYWQTEAFLLGHEINL